ncbi:MAG: type II secretion system F family protein [Propionibacteriaceae bacterium]|nr:type II secretion system F family protein [Propionibacteriaceae bacterium]
MAVIIACLGVLVGCGVWLIVGGARKAPRRRIHVRWPRLDWRSPWTIGAALVAVGLVVALTTGWVVAVVVLPVIGIGLPYLIGTTDRGVDIAKLEAMEEWTRSLSGILTAGAGIEQALVGTWRSTPAPLKPEVSRLVARLRARWTTQAAIRAFADDLDDPTGDIIAANLLLGAQRRGDGLATILEGLAESVALDIRARRQVEADAAKPRTTARWVTIITAVVLAGLFFTGDYVAPYKSGMGQLILLVLLGAYGVVLAWMKKVAAGPPPLRFLGDKAKQGAS